MEKLCAPNSKKWTDAKILATNPLELAFVGDAVFSLYVREMLTNEHNASANALTKMAASLVNAGAQYKSYRKIENLLTDFEKELCIRARNSNIHSRAKNYSVTEYIYATAFEALIGYLYLTEQTERLNQILIKSVEGV